MIEETGAALYIAKQLAKPIALALAAALLVALFVSALYVALPLLIVAIVVALAARKKEAQMPKPKPFVRPSIDLDRGVTRAKEWKYVEAALVSPGDVVSGGGSVRDKLVQGDKVFLWLGTNGDPTTSHPEVLTYTYTEAEVCGAEHPKRSRDAYAQAGFRCGRSPNHAGKHRSVRGEWDAA